MKILITGAEGPLGGTLAAAFAGVETVLADMPDRDVADDEAFTARALSESPDLIVHCAEMGDVDECELDGTSAFELNENGARNAALAAKLCGARLIALSTGYVFSGEPPRQPWAWGEGDIPRPRTVYGMSKFAGEQMIQMIYPENSVILRTDWLYGARGRDFVHTMAELGRRPGEALKVADDRRGNPTSAAVVADVVRFLITRPDVSGIVHATCEDQCTRYELARELFSLLGADRGLIPCASAEFPHPAPRPANCALKKSVLNVLGYRTPNWRDALRDFVAEEFF